MGGPKLVRIMLRTLPQTAVGGSQIDPDMVRARSKQAMLAVGMLLAGSANTITCKLTFNTLSPVATGGEPKPFDHPFVMAGFMFFGECMCLAWFRAQESCETGNARRSSVAKAKREGKQLPFYAFALPASCDLVGTSVMYVGLTMTSASTYQMLRGSVILFTVRRTPVAAHSLVVAVRSRRGT